MAKIVIIAPKGAEDLDDALKILKSAGHDVDVDEPNPKTLLHILLGLFSSSAFGFGGQYAVKAGAGDTSSDEPEDTGDAAPKDDKGAKDEEPTQDETSADFNFEGLTVDGEPIPATRVQSAKSVLVVSELNLGAKTSYNLNESKFSFWPEAADKPTPRVQVSHGKWSTSINIELVKGDKAELQVGDDLIEMFQK